MTDADCPKECAGGSNPGNSCLTYADCPLGECVGWCDEGTLGPMPFYKLSSQWGTAKVRGREILPETKYGVYAQSNLEAGAAFSSATANIAEGNGRFTKLNRKNFFGFARGSVQECIPLLELAGRQGLLKREGHEQLKADLGEIAKMISGLVNGLDQRDT